MESHLEARLWNDVFIRAQSALGLKLGTIKATVLIETLPAAFEMDEILFELRDHIVGLNCGRWDYIFSFIKTFANNKRFVLPDRAQVVMSKAFLAAYSALLIKTCHQPRRLRDGRHGGADSEPQGRGSQSPGLREGAAPTRSARPRTAMTAPGSRIPISCPSPWRCSTR